MNIFRKIKGRNKSRSFSSSAAAPEKYSQINSDPANRSKSTSDADSGAFYYNFAAPAYVSQQFDGRVMTPDVAAAVNAKSDAVIVSMMAPGSQEITQRPRMRKKQLLSNSDLHEIDSAVIAVSITVTEISAMHGIGLSHV